jgi:hypothetical protein
MNQYRSLCPLPASPLIYNVSSWVQYDGLKIVKFLRAYLEEVDATTVNQSELMRVEVCA